MTPTSNNLIIRPIKATEKTTASGIVYELNKPSSDADRHVLKGIVWRVGANVNKDMKNGNRVDEGDIIEYFKDNAVKLQYEGEPLHIVNVKACTTLEKA
jgi:co-chaperonin GroES (HSP10)